MSDTPDIGGANSPAGRTAGISITYLFEAFADRLKFEHDIMSHRMGWLMTANGFFFGAMALLAANSDKLSNKRPVTSALIIVCLAGAISNISCCYSNYWSDVGIREAASDLYLGLFDLVQTTAPPSSNVSAGASTEYANRQIQRLARLHGRDPAAFRRDNKFHAWDLLHPWFFLPLLFMCVFSLSGAYIEKLTGADIRWWWLSIPSLGTILFAICSSIVIVRHELKKRQKINKTICARRDTTQVHDCH